MTAHLGCPSFSRFFFRSIALVSLVLLFAASAKAGGRTKILLRFNAHDGAHPFGALIIDSAGNLYGTTQQGGVLPCGPQRGCGTVFELSPQSDGTWKEQVLYRFQGGSDGDLVYAGVTLDAAGNLYGTTAAGGDNDFGTAYELSPGAGGWTETLLHSFASGKGDGEYPTGSLTFDQSGNLYGTTYVGLNPCPNGTVFELSPKGQGGWTETNLHCFSSDTDGFGPSTNVIFDPQGNLYSTTYLGGPNGYGTVFELSPDGGSWTETIVYGFGPPGLYPWSSLVRDNDGNLYGIVYGGIYELSPVEGGGWTYSPIYISPEGPTGIFPESLIMSEAGDLYGTAEGGSIPNCAGGGGCGVVFKLTHREKGWQMTVLHNFPGGRGGASPSGGMAMDAAGNLYGTTYYGGGGCNCGVVFEIPAKEE
jgi:uncharacterized repeat protein (TIGR03803 family)